MVTGIQVIGYMDSSTGREQSIQLWKNKLMKGTLSKDYVQERVNFYSDLVIYSKVFGKIISNKEKAWLYFTMETFSKEIGKMTTSLVNAASTIKMEITSLEIIKMEKEKVLEPTFFTPVTKLKDNGKVMRPA